MCKFYIQFCVYCIWVKSNNRVKLLSFLYQLTKIIGTRTPIIFWSNYKFLQSALSIRYAEYFSAKLCIHVISLNPNALYIYSPKTTVFEVVDVNWITDICTRSLYFILEFFITAWIAKIVRNPEEQSGVHFVFLPTCLTYG